MVTLTIITVFVFVFGRIDRDAYSRVACLNRSAA